MPLWCVQFQLTGFNTTSTMLENSCIMKTTFSCVIRCCGHLDFNSTISGWRFQPLQQRVQLAARQKLCIGGMDTIEYMLMHGTRRWKAGIRPGEPPKNSQKVWIVNCYSAASVSQWAKQQRIWVRTALYSATRYLFLRLCSFASTFDKFRAASRQSTVIQH
jgi:hypothetical protein